MDARTVADLAALDASMEAQEHGAAAELAGALLARLARGLPLRVTRPELELLTEARAVRDLAGAGWADARLLRAAVDVFLARAKGAPVDFEALRVAEDRRALAAACPAWCRSCRSWGDVFRVHLAPRPPAAPGPGRAPSVQAAPPRRPAPLAPALPEAVPPLRAKAVRFREPSRPAWTRLPG